MTSGTLAVVGAKAVFFQSGAGNGQAEPARSAASGRMDEQPDAVAFLETNLSPHPSSPHNNSSDVAQACTCSLGLQCTALSIQTSSLLWLPCGIFHRSPHLPSLLQKRWVTLEQLTPQRFPVTFWDVSFAWLEGVIMLLPAGRGFQASLGSAAERVFKWQAAVIRAG